MSNCSAPLSCLSSASNPLNVKFCSFHCQQLGYQWQTTKILGLRQNCYKWERPRTQSQHDWIIRKELENMLIYMHTKINVEPECLRKDFGWPHPKQGGMISPFLKLPVQRIHISTSHMMKPSSSSSSSSISHSTLIKKTLRIHNRQTVWKIKNTFGQNIPLLSGSGGIALAHGCSCHVLEDTALLWNTSKLFSIQTNTHPNKTVLEPEGHHHPLTPQMNWNVTTS